MTQTLRRLLCCGLVACALGAAGCGADDDEAADVGGAGEPGATLDGLSREEIQRAAEPMSPEQAEKLGIVDTTIHLENLGDSDTILLPDTVGRARPDSAP